MISANVLKDFPGGSDGKECSKTYFFLSAFYFGFILYSLFFYRASLVAQTVKCLPGVQETRFDPWVGWEDPLEKEMAIHSSTLAWKIPWTEEPGRL